MFIFGLVFIVFLKFRYCDFLRIIVVGDTLAARRSSRNTDNTLGWIALGLLCFVLWLLYKLVLEILIFVTNYWIVILICLSILGLFLLFDRYRQQKKDAERLACEQIAEEQKQILDEMDQKVKLVWDKISQQQAEAKRFKFEEIQKVSILQTKENERIQYIRKKAEDKNRHILLTIKERKRRIQLEKEATLWLEKREAELEIEQNQKILHEERERLSLLKQEARLNAARKREATKWLQQYNNNERPDKDESKKNVVKSDEQTCSACGKLYDCSESFVNFAVGCNEFVPAKRSW